MPMYHQSDMRPPLQVVLQRVFLCGSGSLVFVAPAPFGPCCRIEVAVSAGMSAERKGCGAECSDGGDENNRPEHDHLRGCSCDGLAKRSTVVCLRFGRGELNFVHVGHWESTPPSHFAGRGRGWVLFSLAVRGRRCESGSAILPTCYSALRRGEHLASGTELRGWCEEFEGGRLVWR